MGRMKATHNIKVNGRWIHAGEEIPTEPVQMEINDAIPAAEAEPEAEEHDEEHDEELAAEAPQKQSRRGRKKAE